MQLERLLIVLLITWSTLTARPVLAQRTNDGGGIELGDACSSELEGRLVAGSSGFITGFLFRVVLRTGESTPADVPDRAFFARSSSKCPGRDRVEMSVNRQGELVGRTSLLTDTRWMCRGGRIIEEVSARAGVLILVPGCAPAEVTVESAATQPIPFVCKTTPVAKVYRETEAPSPTTGARVRVSGAVLFLNGVEISLPATVDQLRSALGTETAIARARANDEHSNDVYEWETQGVFAYSRPASDVVNALGVALDNEHDIRGWCHPGAVTVQVNGIALTSKSTPRQFSRAGFREGDFGWELRDGQTYISLSRIESPSSFTEMEIGLSDQ